MKDAARLEHAESPMDAPGIPASVIGCVGGRAELPSSGLEEAGRAVIRLHLWMERGGETLFGLGRMQLLDRVEACGSLKAAAVELGMSYRAAWGKIKASEEALGVALVEKVGGNKSGCRLTRQGRLLAETYRAWFREVERHAVAQANALFPFACRNFRDKPARSASVENDSCATQNI